MINNENLHNLRHSAAHLLAHALVELYPDIKLTIGPVTEEGFFYDFLPTTNLKESDLETIETRMREIATRNLPIIQKEISKKEAQELYNNNPFKLELITDIQDKTIGLSCQGDFCDLCRGGHVASTSDIKHFKLVAISGSYWRANREGQALQRISGIAFLTQEELDEYLQLRKDAELYDHRRLGKTMDLFSFQPEGVGFPFFHPKGRAVLNVMIDYMRSIQRQNSYQEVSTPTVLSAELWKKSGHYYFYKDNMYFLKVEDEEYAIKPMNCPGSVLIFKNRPRSYRELPLRMSEFGGVVRHELSGVLHGLLRVRGFTQDDAHTYCTKDQLEDEIMNMVRMIKTMLTRFDIHETAFAIATKPEKSVGAPELWEKATNALKNALTKLGETFTIKEGEGAFYGPKIEVAIKDSLKRSWQCSTVQVDFNLPAGFDISYINQKGEKEQPIMVHQANFGSLERFFGILIEHYRGAFPFWLAPVQVRILPISVDQTEYAKNIRDLLIKNNVKVEVDYSGDPLSGQIKSAQLDRIPLMIIIGKKESENNTVTIRYRDGGAQETLKLDVLINKLTELITA
jgi:threonyl-tRNA synthetase